MLVFSVNGSEAFQGYARMRSPIGHSRSRCIDPFNGFGRLFDIEWLRLHDLEYREVETLRNPLNGDRHVRFSRDGQELSNEVGKALCNLIDAHVEHPCSAPQLAVSSRASRRRSSEVPPLLVPPPTLSPAVTGPPVFCPPPFSPLPGAAPPFGNMACRGPPSLPLGTGVPLGHGGGVRHSSCSSNGSSGASGQRRRKRRRRDRRPPPVLHPLVATLEEQIEFFKSLDYELYMLWWNRYGSTSPGPTPPPGTELPGQCPPVLLPLRPPQVGIPPAASPLALMPPPGASSAMGPRPSLVPPMLPIAAPPVST